MDQDIHVDINLKIEADADNNKEEHVGVGILVTWSVQIETEKYIKIERARCKYCRYKRRYRSKTSIVIYYENLHTTQIRIMIQMQVGSNTITCIDVPLYRDKYQHMHDCAYR